MANREQWTGFKGKNWQESVDVRDFIQCNYTPYEGCLLYTSPLSSHLDFNFVLNS